VSRGKSSKTKRRGAPIVLPQSLSDGSGAPGGLFLTGNQAKSIQDLVDLLKKNNLTELEVERDGVRIRVRHEAGIKTIAATVTDMPAAVPTSAQSAAPTQAPIVGTFYRSPSPDADPYVEEGDFVKKGQVLCIVEAMKLMNEIESEVDGKVVKILAESTKPVEYGQALFRIDPKATA
jgi:acetyl-CoA carboxylase biotin carboxyl carrier protein